MTTREPLELHIGDVLRLRKSHPCGGTDWEVVRLGADIGLRCTTCQHRILLPRTQLERQVKGFLSHAFAEDGTPVPADPETTAEPE